MPLVGLLVAVIGTGAKAAEPFPEVSQFSFGANVMRPTDVRVTGANAFELLLLPSGPVSGGSRFIVNSAPVSSQSVSIQVGGGYPLEFTADGGFLVGQPDGGAADDFVVRRFSETNTLVWSNSFGGSGKDQLLWILPTSDRGALLYGITRSAAGGQKKSAPIGEDDIWLVKVDEAGSLQWETTIGTISHDVVRSVAQTADGAYVIAANTFSDPSGLKESPSYGGWDMWLIRVSASGQIIWERSFGGARDDVAVHVAERPGGGFVLGGHSASGVSGTKTKPSRSSSPSNRDFYVVHVGADGSQVNDWVYGTTGDETLSAMLVHEHGFVLYGSAQGAVQDGVYRNAATGEPGWMVLADQAGRQTFDAAIPPAGMGFGDILLPFGVDRFILSGSRADAAALVIDFRSAPLITAQPRQFGGAVDSSVELSVEVSSTDPSQVFYQWQRDGQDITGATNRTYTIPLLAQKDAGSYSVVVSNPFGSATSAVAQVEVFDPMIEVILIPGLRLTGTVGSEYEIQTANDPTAGEWAKLADVVQTNAVQLWVDDRATAGERRYYRAVKR